MTVISGRDMRGVAGSIAVIMVFPLLFFLSCSQPRPISSWERHCQACHDGKTVLNGKVVIGKEEMRAKYRTFSQFLNACGDSASCMNILKHQEKLLREVGEELGIKDH